MLVIASRVAGAMLGAGAAGFIYDTQNAMTYMLD